MADYKGKAFLVTKLNHKKRRVEDRYTFYEMKNAVPDFGISTPPKLIGTKTVLGWCCKAVDVLAARLQYRGFSGDVMDMAAIYSNNNGDILMDSMILSALISSCCFVYISPDEDGYPRLQVIDGGNATGIIDPVTSLLTEGYAILKTDDNGNTVLDAWFTPEFTEYSQRGQQPYRVNHPAGYPLLVPIINRPDAKRVFGHSRISRACMDLQQAAARTAKRSEIAAEFYSFPQKYVVGLSNDADEIDKWKASMSSMFTLTKDEDGDVPKMGQFTTMSQQPHIDQLRAYAALFAGETGLTLDDLGFVSDNPSSAEAIKASHENLRLMARKAQRDFGVGILNAGLVAGSLRDKHRYDRAVIRDTKVLWEPIFEPDSSMLSGIGDGIGKLNQAVPGYITGETLRSLTGIEGGGNG